MKLPYRVVAVLVMLIGAGLLLGTRTLVNLAENVMGILPVSNGGNGTASPSLTAGTNVTLGGSWPSYSINATRGAFPQSYEISDGTNYYMWWPPYQVTDPTGVGFSWLNQAGATETVFGPALALANANTTIRIPSTRYISIGANTTLVAAIVPLLYGEFALTNLDPAACVFFHEVSSGHMVSLNAGWHPTTHVLQVFVSYYTSTTTFNSVLATSSLGNYSEQVQYILLRLQLSGSNLVYSWSSDGGLNYHTLLTEAKTAHFTTVPDNWGYGVVSPNSFTSFTLLTSWKTT